MKIIPSKYVKPLFTEDFYEADVWGGRGRGGSHGITQHALFKMVTSTYFRGYFVRAIQGSIRDSLWQDFKDRIEEASDLNHYKYENDFKMNDSNMSAIYLPKGNIIKSKGFRASTKANTANMKSIAGATHVYIEETEEVGEIEYNKLADSLRTIKAPVQIIRSWNPPPKEHWLVKNYHTTVPTQYEGFYDLEPKGIKGHLSIKGDYYMNIKNIDANTQARYERYAETSPKYYYGQIKGLVSDGGDNRVYNNWKVVSLPDFIAMDLPSVYGLDIGDISPNALVEVKYDANTGSFYSHEILYESSRSLKVKNPKPIKGLLADEFELRGIDKKKPIMVDAAARDSIIELRNAKYNAMPSIKPPGSVKTDIEFINRANNHYTETSHNIDEEYTSYYLETDQYKVPIEGKPIKGNDHLMDAIKYAKTFMRVKHKIVL